MELGTIIIGSVMLITFSLPFILSARSTKKNEQKMLKSLYGLAEKFHSKVSQYELWSNSAIGLCSTSNNLFFFRLIEENETAICIKLNEIQKCKINTISRVVKSNNENYKIIEKLELCFLPIAKNKPDIILEFYNDEINAQLCDELLLIEKWEKVVNHALLLKK